MTGFKDPAEDVKRTMGNKMKTLKELADEVGGFPFEAVNGGVGTPDTYKCIGIAPDGQALGWYLSGSHHLEASIENKSRCWTLVTPKKKLVEFLMEFADGSPCVTHAYGLEAAKKHCDDNDAKFIKILREVEI